MTASIFASTSESIEVGDPDMAPHTPQRLGSAPAKPWRSSLTLGALLDEITAARPDAERHLGIY